MKFLTALSVATGVIAAAGVSGVLLLNHHSAASPLLGSAPPSGVLTSAVPGSALASTAAASSGAVQFTVTGASQQSCSAEGTVSSTATGLRVLFYFQNATSEPLRIVWISYSGSPETYDTLPPGYAYSVNTFAGNVWLISDTSSSCLGIFDIEGSGHITASG